MTPAELAARLDGREYPFDRSDDFRPLMAEAKAAGLIVIYGASDDLMEFEGAIHDEVGAWGGATALLDQGGLLPARDCIEDDRELEEFFERRKTAAIVVAVWGKGDASWTYTTALPHSNFHIMEDGETYCVGIVIAVSNLPPRSLAAGGRS